MQPKWRVPRSLHPLTARLRVITRVTQHGREGPVIKLIRDYGSAEGLEQN